MAFAHNVDPALEDNEANRDLILNPPPLDLSAGKGVIMLETQIEIIVKV